MVASRRAVPCAGLRIILAKPDMDYMVRPESDGSGAKFGGR